MSLKQEGFNLTHVSRTTPTIINIPVPPKNVATLYETLAVLNIKSGKTAIIVKNIAPAKVVSQTKSKKRAVCSPGRTPGT